MAVMSKREWGKLCRYMFDDFLVNIVADFYWDSSEQKMMEVDLTPSQIVFMKRRSFEVIDKEPRDYRDGPQQSRDYPYIYLLPPEKAFPIIGNLYSTMLLYLDDGERAWEHVTWHFGFKDPSKMTFNSSINLLEQLVALCAPMIDQRVNKYSLDKPIKIYVHDGFKLWMDVAHAIKEKYS